MDAGWIKSKPIAHRGLHNEKSPENSMEAFKNAIRHQYAIETDVQLSKDGEIVIFHDYDLRRMTGIASKVNQLTLNELKELRLKGSSCDIPTLGEALQMIKGQAPLLIEIKNEGNPGPLEEKLCNILAEYKGEFAVQSFNPFSMKAVKKLQPDFIRGQLSSKFKNDKSKHIKMFIVEHFFLKQLSDPDFIAYNINDLPDGYMENLRDGGMPLLAWTVKTEKQLEKARACCDNVIFETIII